MKGVIYVRKLMEVLQNKADNYIFPFLWLHHESEDTLRKSVQAIYKAGIKEFCLESRPHPEFVEKGWWEDLDIIFDEAKKYGMKIWILDDAHFPTGFANGKVDKKHRKLYLSIKQLDFAGPQNDAMILLNYLNPEVRFSPSQEYEEKILKVLMAKKTGDDSIAEETLVDITANLHKNRVFVDIPDGQWRIFALVETVNGGEKETKNYLNPLDKKATQILIKEVYEKHYQHYKDEFEKTLVGFFSDEPRFGNQHGSYSQVGKSEMVLPWREGMLEEFFVDDYKYLVLLTKTRGSGKEKEIRLKYMDIVSRLYGQNFTCVLGNWCRKHGIEYIGHLIEDNGAHTRLGYGAGHYFRALSGQDMAGIDVVLNQIMPGLDTGYFKSMTATGWNGEFFHYGLGKLGASLGHLDPLKKGKTMSEVFGAYGWAEGLPLMKYLADHMLVRGVNYFVPHAFNSNSFPDYDCPPHLYANGHALQEDFYPTLFNYINRISHLLTGGNHLAKIGVLYHAELEWLDSNAMPFEKVTKQLMQNQIECEVIPIDYLEQAMISNGKYTINGQEFHVLIFPQARVIPQRVVAILEKFKRASIRVIFTNQAPSQTEKSSIDSTKWGEVITLNELANALIEYKILDIANFTPEVRVYDYTLDDEELIMLFNERKGKDAVVKLDNPKFFKKKLYLYDGINNILTKAFFNQEVKLSAGESRILLISTQEYEVTPNRRYQQELDLSSKEWKVSLESLGGTSEKLHLSKLVNINHLEGKEDFSGTMIYETRFNLSERRNLRISLGEVGEVCQVNINGNLVQRKISKPYTVKVDAKNVNVGENILEVKVVNNWGPKIADMLSQYIAIKPAGLLGPVEVEVEVN